MKLKDFIQESLVEIAFGIHEAKVKTKELVAICPGMMGGESVDERSYVEFDIAVAVSETKGSANKRSGAIKAEINVMTAKFGAELGKDKNNSDLSQVQNVSRIQFKVPVYFHANYRKDKRFNEDNAFILNKLEENA